MRTFEQYIREGVDFRLGGKGGRERLYQYHPENRNELIFLVDKLVKENGNDANLNDIDTSKVTDMSNMFTKMRNPYLASIRHIDISLWDTSNVTDMSSMFFRAALFDSDISNWDTSKVENMKMMFSLAREFNQDISQWNVSSVTNMDYMFNGCKWFNQDISGWDVSNVTNHHKMFYNCQIKAEFMPKFKFK